MVQAYSFAVHFSLNQPLQMTLLVFIAFKGPWRQNTSLLYSSRFCFTVSSVLFRQQAMLYSLGNLTTKLEFQFFHCIACFMASAIMQQRQLPKIREFVCSLQVASKCSNLTGTGTKLSSVQEAVPKATYLLSAFLNGVTVPLGDLPYAFAGGHHAASHHLTACFPFLPFQFTS